MTNKHLTIFIVCAVIIAAILIPGLSDKPDQSKLIKISVVMPFSGELAMFGDNVIHGVEISLKQSGLSSSTVEIIREDTGGFTTNGALSAFKRSIDQDKADIVFGPFGPAQTLTIAPTIGSSSQVTVISVSNCDERFEQYPTVFCIYPGLRDQVEHAIGFMKSKSWKNVYLLTENSEFGIMVEGILKEDEGVTFLGSEKVIPNQTKDFRTLITKAVALKPDVIYSAFAPTEGLIVLRQYSNLSKGVPLYIGTDVNKQQLADIFGQHSQNIYFAAKMSDTYEKVFADEFKDRYGRDPDYFAALGHSAASILFDTIKSKSTDISDLPKRLIGITASTSAVRGFLFKENRTVSVPLHSYEFRNGDFVEVM